MQVPLEFTTREIPERSVERCRTLVEAQLRKLESLAPEMIACAVAIERPQRSHRSGNTFRVRIRLTIPPHKELVVAREPVADTEALLAQAIRAAFGTMRRRLESTRSRRRGDVKQHHEPSAIVVRLHDDYGFIKESHDGHEIYFHRNAVAGDFERLSVGTQVRFVETMGIDGPQASTVKIVDKPGVRAEAADEPAVEPPHGWRS